jgi:hypothetical protein
MIVTISHKLGCGGSALGQKLSEQLGIPFFDREILIKVAEELHLAESVIQGREERLSGFWQFLNRIAVLSDPVESLSMQGFGQMMRGFILQGLVLPDPGPAHTIIFFMVDPYRC